MVAYEDSEEEENALVTGMNLGHVRGCAKADLSQTTAVLHIPENRLPSLAGGEQISAASRPTQERDALAVPAEFPSDAHCLKIPYHDSAVDSAGSEVVPLSIKSEHGRMAGADRVCDVFRVILEQVVVGKKQIHDERGRAKAASWYPGCPLVL